jgi:Na+/H+ antiporter NhaD/arsenite permease-like protein
MEALVVIVFIAGYLMIAFEHPVGVNKTASALLTGVLCWTLFILSPASDGEHAEHVSTHLGEHLSSISEILFFLMGAMTVVELIDAHNGFRIITEKIATTNPRKLLWIICIVTFFLSAILDNLTTTIVMVSLIRKLVDERRTRLLFIGMIIIAANAGGAWTPLGDVTTTMLWIGGQITALNIMKALFIPSLVSIIVPLILMRRKLSGTLGAVPQEAPDDNVKSGKIMLVLGIAVMLGVPAFKMVTHLPPYMGMLAGVAVLWIVSEFTNRQLDVAVRKNYTAAAALQRIDVPSILFFLGILLAVGALESMMILRDVAGALSELIGDQRIIVTLIGVVSAIVDNVPLVAATMGMYDLASFPTDHFLWTYLAYCAGTGGSLLIIGSAAGVAAMGMERIDFIWYLKNLTLIALAGYVAGALTYLLMSGTL